MSIKQVKIVGYAHSNEQFIVNTNNFKVRISKNSRPELEGPSPLEYVLAGYAGCINAVGKLVAKELNLDLKFLQVEIAAVLSLDKFQGKESNNRAGFQVVVVVVKPTSDASHEDLQKWISIVKNRCPIHDNLINPTPIHLNLVPQYETLELVS